MCLTCLVRAPPHSDSQKTHMTIDSSWIACMKSDVPQAFTPSAPFAPDAVFIDGQIKLMCPNIEGTLTWDEYLRRQFERTIVRYLQSGVSCVILAFDDYRHVPCSKSMTQAKRRRNVPTLEFGDRSSLPPLCPEVRSCCVLRQDHIPREYLFHPLTCLKNAP